MTPLSSEPISIRLGLKVGDEAIGRSGGGLSTKIHATCDALDNPTGLYLNPGQAHDLQGADILLSEIEAGALLVDRAYDADERLRHVLKSPADCAGDSQQVQSKSCY